MADPFELVGSPPTLASIHARGAQNHRARPSELVSSIPKEHRVPLRVEAERLQRRESKLGLKNLFGRGRTQQEIDALPLRGDTLPRGHGGIRASLADFGHWNHHAHVTNNSHTQAHQRNHNQPRTHAPIHEPVHESRANVVSPTAPRPSLRSVATAPNLRHQRSTSNARGQTMPSRPVRSSIASWEPPPLFQAYPQAIKHATLPACTMSAEAIIRMHNHKGSISLRDGLTHSSLALDTTEESSSEQSGKGRFRHRRNTSGSSAARFEWTTKIYMLVTSGYLLQYAGEGTFDRLPEKILTLGKNSAAFVSDLIPGRHWVLQVSSVTDEEGTAATHAPSLLSRLPFRGADKRHASNQLLVFERAEEMEGWIQVLRREIEALGGKKNLSETGQPKANDASQHVRSRAGQRTMVVRDPDRFSKILTPDMSWEQGGPVGGYGAHLEAGDGELVRDRSFDDGSTASGISQDGRQLESLRDSANRLSFISSGQRTVVTSAGSSPACSPVRETFDLPDPHDLPIQLPMPPLPLPPPKDPHREMPREVYPEPVPMLQAHPRLRPNAAAIHDRRVSMQTNNHLFEIGVATADDSGPLSSSHNSWHPQAPLPVPGGMQPATPNFSVPQASQKRFSFRPSLPDSASNMLPIQRHPPAKVFRRPPPSALLINARPLSFVQDHPSPLSPPPDIKSAPPTWVVSPASTAPDTPSMFAAGTHQSNTYRSRPAPSPEIIPREQNTLPGRKSSLNSKQNTVQLTVRQDLRRQVSTGSIRSTSEHGDSPLQIYNTNRRSREANLTTPVYAPIPVLPSPPSGTDDPERPKTASSPREPAPRIQPNRLSLFAHPPPMTQGPPLSMVSNELPLRSRTPSLKPAPKLVPSSQHLRVDSGGKTSMQRRSMPQLVEGPPPVPPPTCALPPIPRKFSEGESLRTAHLRV